MINLRGLVLSYQEYELHITLTSRPVASSEHFVLNTHVVPHTYMVHVPRVGGDPVLSAP